MAQKRKRSPLKSEVANTRIRDEDGHFLSDEEARKYLKSQKSALPKFFTPHIHSAKDDDDILDIHVGNPLHKITKLLEDLKKQKAFSFSLKGSLGIMGVFLTLSVFGVLGGGQLLCDKGTQTQIGTIRTLQVMAHDTKAIPFLQDVINYFRPKVERNSVVLIKADYAVIKLAYSRFVDLGQYNDTVVMATGQYDSCSQQLTVKEATAIEIFQ